MTFDTTRKKERKNLIPVNLISWTSRSKTFPAWKSLLQTNDMIQKKSYLLNYRKSLGTVFLKAFPSSVSRLCASLRCVGQIGPDSLLSFIIVLAAKIITLTNENNALQHFYHGSTMCRSIYYPMIICDFLILIYLY